MKKCVFLSILFSFSAFGQTIDPDKFTICAATINSSDEIDMIKKQLDPKKFNPVVELTDIGSEKDWFEKACESGIRCDQLVISGHFTGQFFGEKKKHILHLNDLEKKSCAKTCEGILKSPLEVFLLGCNTLASKDLDHRTPEQYLQVLLAEGISNTEARQITEARYGDLGESNRARMQGVFGDNKKIYGFSSTGPLGSIAKNYVSNYLSKINMSSHLEKLSHERMLNKIEFSNNALMNSFKGTPIAECEGISADDPEMQLKCKLIDPKTNLENKLLVVEEMFTKDNFLSFVPMINREFYEQKNIRLSESSGKEKEVFERLKNNDVIKQQIIGVMKKSPNLGTSVEMISLLKTFQMVSNDESDTLFKERLELILKTPMTDSIIANLCESAIQTTAKRVLLKTFDANNIHPSYLKNENGITGLRCINAISPSVVDKLISLPSGPLSYNKKRAITVVGSGFDSDAIADFVAKDFKSKVIAKDVLFVYIKGTKSEHPKIKSIVDEEILSDGDQLNYALMYYSVGNKKVDNLKVRNALEKISASGSSFSKIAAEILTH